MLKYFITMFQRYPISVSWEASSDGGESSGEIEVFPSNHAVPFSKMLTFYRREPFSIKGFYTGSIPYTDQNIGKYQLLIRVNFLLKIVCFSGTWVVKDVCPGADGKAQKVKVKVRINLHGIMNVSSASLIESKEAVEPDTPEDGGQQSKQGDEGMDTAQGSEAGGENGQPPEVGSSSPTAKGWTRKISAWFGRVR